MHDGHLALGGHHSASKRVKIEAPDEELSSGSMKAPTAPSEEYYCRNPAGGSSLVVVKQQPHETSGDGGNHSSGTDNEDNNDASSTENYEPLDFKAWRAQHSASNNTSNAAVSNEDDDDNDDDDEDDEDGYANTISGRASLTVEVGPASSARLMDTNSATTGPDYLTQTVRSAK